MYSYLWLVHKVAFKAQRYYGEHCESTTRCHVWLEDPFLCWFQCIFDAIICPKISSIHVLLNYLIFVNASRCKKMFNQKYEKFLRFLL